MPMGPDTPLNFVSILHFALFVSPSFIPGPMFLITLGLRAVGFGVAINVCSVALVCLMNSLTSFVGPPRLSVRRGRGVDTGVRSHRSLLAEYLAPLHKNHDKWSLVGYPLSVVELCFRGHVSEMY